MSESLSEKKFPSDCLVPKTETGVVNFLRKYPENNGEGVVIAIFDSGVDPKAAGLQKTPDGEPKIIERFDCSGCGDVDMSKKVTATADGTIIGLSGRALKLTPSMKTSNIVGNEYRVGLKSLYDLYPSKTKEKIIADTKIKQFNEPHKNALANVARQIEQFELANKDLTNVSAKDKLVKDDLDAQLEFLNAYEKKYSDIRSTFDCVLYQTNDGWTAVIDTTEEGDLTNALTLGEYSKTFDVKSIDDFLSVSMNIHDDGNVLEIVGLCSSHGTHVASIAAGNHSPDNPELDGVAPAAKIISISIGDSRLSTEETGAAIVRAMIKVMELCKAGRQVHVINMSYGEHGHWSNSGRVGELMTEVVNKYGVCWVVSAGNEGPALCTVGTPPDIIQPCMIGVGAFVSPGMMEAEYALRHKLPANVYTWTSRDPCIDGGSAVTVCAPGAAIASVPSFTLAKQQLLNGTSMAAPHVAGAVAAIISGLLKNNVAYSPYSVKRALWNTATRLSYVDPFAQGNGLLNVEKAYEYLLEYKDETENDIRFSVVVGMGKAKGIHIRTVDPEPREYSVTVEPVFCNDLEIAPARKLNFNKRITLVPSESWVQSGSYLDLSYSARTISVRVDPTGLPIGVHSAKICAYDSANIAKGTLFEVPITVVIPIKVDTAKTRTVTFDPINYKPNTITRHFVYVPNNATWAVLKLRSPDTMPSVPAKFFIHTMQLLRHKNCKSLAGHRILSISSENFTTHAFKCEGNEVLEICIAKYWSCAGDSLLEANVEFRGIWSKTPNTMHSANGIHRIDITTLATEDVLPAIQLKSAVTVLKPSESKISPLTTRDIIPPGRQIYQNLLTYNLHLMKNQEVCIHSPLLSDVLYESAFESQLWMIFDVNKMMVGCGDAYTKDNCIKLDKGDYVIRLQIRHEKKELLERFSEAVIQVAMKLPNTLSLDCYRTYNSAVTNGKKISAFQLQGRISCPIYVATLANEKGIPSQCSWLDGTITYAKEEPGRKVDSSKFQYILTEGPSPKKSNGCSKENKSKWDEYREGLRDFQINMLPKLEIDKAEEVLAEILEEFPDYVAAYIAMIQKLDTADLKQQLPMLYQKSLSDKSFDVEKSKSTLNSIIEYADLVIKKTDTNALLAYYGLKSDTRTDAAKIKINMDKQKSSLLEAYVKKAIALSKLRLIEMSQNNKEKIAAGSCSDVTPATALTGDLSSLDELDNIYTEVGKFIDYADSKVIYLSLWHGFMHQQYGRMLKALLKQYEDKLQRDILEEMYSVVREKGWNHISDGVKKTIVSANPGGYRLF